MTCQAEPVPTAARYAKACYNLRISYCGGKKITKSKRYESLTIFSFSSSVIVVESLKDIGPRVNVIVHSTFNYHPVDQAHWILNQLLILTEYGQKLTFGLIFLSLAQLALPTAQLAFPTLALLLYQMFFFSSLPTAFWYCEPVDIL